VRGIERAIGQRLPRLTLAGFDYARRSTGQWRRCDDEKGRDARPVRGIKDRGPRASRGQAAPKCRPSDGLVQESFRSAARRAAHPIA
jgi:hypothetical protein